MRANSLALRLFLTASFWIVVILLVTGLVLSSLYRQAVERAFDHRLDSYLRTLVADLASPEDNDRFPQSLGEPLFSLPLSGWYWQVTRLDTQKPEVRSSRSLWDGNLPRIEASEGTVMRGGTRVGYVPGPEAQKLRQIERTIDLGADGRYFLAVAGDAFEIDDEVASFNTALITTFAILGVVLLLTTMFQVRFGLAPLKRISESLAAIRAGTAERLEGKFPVEIEPLARETNALIESNREIVERARTHVGNLAHALKTPLSVMLNEAAARPDDPLASKVREQVDVMRDQVARHLERARLAARTAVMGSITDVVPVIQSIARTMEKTYHAKNLAIALELPPEARFRGERADLEEMVGNLVDNACKWASSRVSIEVELERPAPDRNAVRIVVDDDGPGLTPAERAQVARRGKRLDESKPGSGLGLSIVLETASLYGGNLHLGSSPIGGLRAELTLPAAAA
ncbi:MAG TPA: sensor histidine kinase [Xanthobacteraceae bacterium]|nr:sensor histidine kinase [Xanthobacteraceae bacterium]